MKQHPSKGHEEFVSQNADWLLRFATALTSSGSHCGSRSSGDIADAPTQRHGTASADTGLAAAAATALVLTTLWAAPDGGEESVEPAATD